MIFRGVLSLVAVADLEAGLKGAEVSACLVSFGIRRGCGEVEVGDQAFGCDQLVHGKVVPVQQWRAGLIARAKSGGVDVRLRQWIVVAIRNR